jgi:CelD/BcsL family acetyltransferase involved in cellulose biosynthesis
MKLTIVKDIDSFSALEDEWNSLLENSANNTLCLRWEWMFHYYDKRCNGQDLLLFLVRDSRDQLVGIAPFILRKQRLLRKWTFLEFLGQRYSYHLGIIAHSAHRDEVYQHICDHLIKYRKKWDVLKFTNLSNDALLYKHLKTHFEKWSYFWTERIHNACKVIRIDGSFDEYISSLGKHFSKKTKYKLRKIRRDFHVGLSQPDNETDLMRSWRTFVDLHLQAVEDKGTTTVLSDPQYERFYRSVAQSAFRNGTLALIAMMLDGRIAAVKFAILRGRTCYFLNSGYERDPKYSLYLLSTMLCMEELLKSDVDRFDFMGGGGSHKDAFGATDEDGLTIEVMKTMPFVEAAIRRALRNVAAKLTGRDSG